MARSYGSAATLLVQKEDSYGVKPTGNWEKFSFVSSDLSAEQNLISSELLGQGREPQAPFRDVIKDDGNIVVPVEGGDFGRWLQFLLGDPTTSENDGAYTHTFTSGAENLPSFAVEIGHTAVPAYFVHTGCRLNSLALNFQRSGTANATLNIMAQGETRVSSSQGGSATRRSYKPFSQFTGAVRRNGTALGNITGAQFTYGNGLQPVPTLRNDMFIDGIDPTTLTATGSIEARFADTVLVDDAINNMPIELEFSYSRPDGFALTWTFHEVYLPRPRIPISGPGGVQCTFNWQAALDETLSKSVTVVLKNDIPSYL